VWVSLETRMVARVPSVVLHPIIMQAPGTRNQHRKIRDERADMNSLSFVARPDHSCRRALRSAHVEQPSPT
jgi:hypothetical protein